MSRVEDLRIEFDEDFAVEISRWEIPDRGISALLGPSGSGKSTIVRTLLGLNACPGLHWWFGDLDLAKVPVPERKLGVVFQTAELFPHMSARQNVEFAAEVRGIDKQRSRKRIEALVESLNMQAYWGRKAAVLSGGEAQRVALARALVGEPRFLFLDEPFSSLDQQLKSEARTLVRTAIDQFQIPTLLITHDPQDVEALASHVFQLNNGKLRS